MKPFVLAFLLICTFQSFGQVADDFKRLKCEGEMPDDFKTAFSEKYLEDIESNSAETDLSKNDVKEFAVLTNYYNHSLLTGGSVLYGDPISNYCNKILQALLTKENELLQKLRVYTIKSNQVNAYSTNNGIIYVTLGLMGRVENEAQLAYVLAHEISHYNNHHVLQSFENEKEIWAVGGGYGNLNFEERTLTAYKYSRDAEFEADKEALIYYLQAGYSIAEINNGFDVLLHGYLPIAEQKYKWDKLENDDVKIPDYYLIDSVSKIRENDDVDDKFLTHPNIQKRKKAVQQELWVTAPNPPGIKYVVASEKDFGAVQDLGRFEMLNAFIKSGNFISALYHIQVLESKYSNHPFLNRMELMCWYGMQQLVTNQQKKVYSAGYVNVEGEEQALYYFASKMPKRGINILATKFIWGQTENMVQDSFITIIRRQSLQLLSETVKRDFFQETKKSKTDFASLGKMRKNIDFLKYAFVELFNNDGFKQAFDKAYSRTKRSEGYVDETTNSEEKLIHNQVRGVSSYYGLADVNKMLFLNPKFFRIDLRKDLDERLIVSDKQQTDLQERTSKLSQLAGVELVTLDNPNPDYRNTEAFNDFVVIQNWLHEESIYEGQDFYSYSTQYLSALREKYDTDYLGVNYVVHYSDVNKFNSGYFFMSVLTFYPFPYYLYWQIKPLHNLEYAFVVFDLKQGDVGFYDLKSFPAKYRKGVINSHLYNSFNQLNRAR